MTSLDTTLVRVPAARGNRPNPPITRTPVGITDHHMAGYLPGTDKLFQDPATGYATNLGIGSLNGRDYVVHEYVPDNQVAWGNGNDDLNRRSVSIEHENNRAQGYASKPTEETHELSARVHAMLAVKWEWRIRGELVLVLGDFPAHDFYGRSVPGFGRDFNVITHRSVALKDCPNDLDVRWIVDRANRIIREGIDPEPETPTDQEDIMQHVFSPGSNAGRGAVISYAPGFVAVRVGDDHDHWNARSAALGLVPTDEAPRNAARTIQDEYLQSFLHIEAGLPIDWDLNIEPVWTEQKHTLT